MVSPFGNLALLTKCNFHDICFLGFVLTSLCHSVSTSTLPFGCSIKYADTGSLIQILLKEDTDYYKLYITNRGKQIEEEKRELIFDRFYQMGQGSGIGIGLHLAREIVTLHQGTLKVVDRSGLEETVNFQFILPKMIAKDHAQEERNLTIS